VTEIYVEVRDPQQVPHGGPPEQDPDLGDLGDVGDPPAGQITSTAPAPATATATATEIVVTANSGRHSRQDPATVIVDDQPVPTVVYDLATRIVRYANPAFALLAGREPESLPGCHLDELLRNAERLLPMDAPVADDPDLIAGEFVVGTRQVEARTWPLDYAGEPCGQAAFWDITERVNLEQQILHRASHDQLTGLPNSWYTTIYLRRALRDADAHLAVFFIDLDGFKQINDQHGHKSGDVVLRQTASRLRAAVSTADLCARLHGDEFLVLCRVANTIHAAHLAQRIRRALSRPIQIGKETVTVSASVGIAVSTGSSTDAERLLRFADHRMYTDKRNSPVMRSRRRG
jgi:diguanylate cyclase (GGDEF)-like protein